MNAANPFIVAELSASHNGSLQEALELVTAAARAGADAIKIQAWHPEKMVADPGWVIPSGAWKGYAIGRLYREAHLPWIWIPQIFAKARAVKLIPFASVFDVESLEMLERLDCPFYKIASCELIDTGLLRAVAARGKPMILSTGMATRAEVEAAIEVSIMAGSGPVTILKCTAGYPAPLNEANVSMLLDLAFIKGVSAVGVSDHTLGNTVALVSIGYGASMFEKHISLTRKGLDGGFASLPDEFADYCQAIRAGCSAQGVESWGPSPSELSTYGLRRSLYWAREVPAGATILPGDVTTARPAMGLHPHELPRVLRSRAARPVTKGKPVILGDLA